MRKLVAVTQMTLDGVIRRRAGRRRTPAAASSRAAGRCPISTRSLRRRSARPCRGPSTSCWDAKPTRSSPPIGRTTRARLRSASTARPSTSLRGRSTVWSGTTRPCSREVETAVAALKEGDGPELQVYGSSQLLQTLLKHKLIDEFRLWIFPVVVGPGKRLFGEGTVPAGLTLVDSKVTTTGVIVVTYRPAGRIQSGSFAFEGPTEREIKRRKRLDA